jgi:DNA modification methylase
MSGTGKSVRATKERPRTRLDGATWLRYSISIWSDLKKSREEEELGHPAIYPAALVKRLLDCYFFKDWGVVLDPFLGSGSTLVAAQDAGICGVGFEIVPEIARMAYRRLRGRMPLTFPDYEVDWIEDSEDAAPISFRPGEHRLTIIRADARKIPQYLPPESVDIVITSPPYWIVHGRERSVDRKTRRPYSDLPEDLGNIPDYEMFLDHLVGIFEEVMRVLKPGSFCIVNVMDLRYGTLFIPFHSDLIFRISRLGMRLEDIIIWNRAHEYNNLRPIGYPYRFIVNKVHEYIMIFRKPGGEE